MVLRNGRQGRVGRWRSRFGLLLGAAATFAVTVPVALALSDDDVPPPPPVPEGNSEPKGEQDKRKAPNVESHTVQTGDTLWTLSGRYMGNSYEWPRLWSYNPEVTNPHWIYPGHVLRLRADAEGGSIALGGPASARSGLGMAPLPEDLPAFAGVQIGHVPSAMVMREEIYLDKDALKQSGKVTGAFEDHMMLSTTDEVYVEFERQVDVMTGQELTVFGRHTMKEHSPVAADVPPHDPDNPGEIVRVLGTLKVNDYNPRTKVARAVIIETLEPIERGYRVANVSRRFLTVEPVPAERTVTAGVVAVSRAIGMAAQHYVVFLDVGETQGVRAGNRFMVRRQGDVWRQQLRAMKTPEHMTGAERPTRNPPPDDRFPVEVVGELIVLHTRPNTSTALVLHSAVEIDIGDNVIMREGY